MPPADFVARRANARRRYRSQTADFRIVRELAAEGKSVVFISSEGRSCRWCVTASCYYSAARSRGVSLAGQCG